MQEHHDDLLMPLVRRLDLDEKVGLLTGQDSWSLRAIPKIGLRSIVMSDGPAGVRGAVWDERHPSCNFPSPTALSSSWDRERMRSVGEGLGSEARRKNVDVVLAPTINLHRTPYGGRHFEAFSEDPVLTAELATPFVDGIQTHGVAATVKHYVANDSETDRFTVDVRADERTLRELYLLAFEAPVVEGRSWLVMSAYNSINGATASENPLLTTPLSDEWGFDGVVVSDWMGVRSLEAARHPQHVVMPGPQGPWGDHLVAAVRSGDIDESLVDEKVLRILRLAVHVGALDGYAATRSAPLLTDAQLRQLARSSSSDGMVLLSNKGVLPIGEPARIAVVGDGARVARTQGGGSATVIPQQVVSPVEGIQRRWPNAQVEWSLGAIAQRGLAPLEDGAYTTPDGPPGLLVRYLDSDGEEISREVRQATSLVWFDGSSDATKSATIEFALRYSPGAVAGETRLGIAGICDYEVLVDGALIASGELRTKPGDDHASVVLNPPSTAVDVPFPGTSADIVVRYRPVAGGIPDALSLRLGVPPAATEDSELIADAVRAAAEADVAVVVVSTSHDVESEGFDRDTLRLPGAQDDLVHAVAAVNDNTIVVVNAGAPVLLPWRDEVAAVLAVWFPGQEFGDALADVLSGDAEPGGRLPVTWPVDESELPVREVEPVDGRLDYREGIHIGYRAWRRSGLVPAYPFGHGLGYTQWELSELAVGDLDDAESVTASLLATNVGARPGKTVVQLYLERASESAVDRPERWLAGFEVVRVEPGEAQRVEIELPWRRFAHWADGDWQVEAGTFRLTAGLSSTDDRLGATITAGSKPEKAGVARASLAAP